MKRLALVAVALACAGCGGAPSSPSAPKGGGGGLSGATDKGLRLYLDGRFDEAEAPLRAAAAADAKDWIARRVLGRILLLKNRLPDARTALTEAVDRSADRTSRNPHEREPDPIALQDLAWTYYRMDDYDKASRCFLALSETALAKKYGEMAKRVPYTMSWNGTSATMRFFERAPVPVVQMRVNGAAGLFAIDTSMGELILNKGFARTAGAKTIGTAASTAAGIVEEAYVDAIDVTGLQVRNVPVAIHKLQAVGPRELDGIIGSGFLSHFNVTINYGGGHVTLRKRGTGERARGGQELPLYLAADRYFLVPGAIDDKPALLFVHTGATGRAFVPSPTGVNAQPEMKTARVGPIASDAPRGRLDPKDPQSPVGLLADAFPRGVDTTFGFVVAGMLGPDAFAGRSVTFDLDRMVLVIE